MKVADKIKEKLERNRYCNMFLNQYDFKTMVLSFFSMIINIVFATVNLVCAFLYESLWYGTLAGYYFTLILFRGIVVSSAVFGKANCRDDSNGYLKLRHKIYLASGIFLVLIQIAMSVAVMQTVLSDKAARSGEIIAIATAAYVFYKLVAAIVNLVRAKKSGDHVVQSLRNLNFVDACMSMVSLTVLMLGVFDETGDESFLLPMKAGVGFAACFITLAIAVTMIVKSCFALKKHSSASLNPK
ncbi:MAG: hypothetical protein HFK08_01885 [Clostridia bacterium]|nr:hypothetical protein [Clostridia bacterium]